MISIVCKLIAPFSSQSLRLIIECIFLKLAFRTWCSTRRKTFTTTQRSSITGLTRILLRGILIRTYWATRLHWWILSQIEHKTHQFIFAQNSFDKQKLCVQIIWISDKKKTDFASINKHSKSFYWAQSDVCI